MGCCQRICKVSSPFLVLADSRLFSRYVDTPRAVVRKLKFGPGKGNRRIIMLYSNRMEIRDVSEVLLYQYTLTAKIHALPIGCTGRSAEMG